MNLAFPVAVLASGMLSLAACGDQQMASNDTYNSRLGPRDDTVFPSSRPTSPRPDTLGNTPTGTGTINPNGATSPDADGIPPAATPPPTAPPPVLPPT
jgi:hypothetical protein